MSQLLILKNKGLYTSPNEFSSVPEGALVQADNCSIDVDNIIEPRRGFSRQVAFASGGDRARRYAFYQSQQIAAYTSGKLAYLSAGSWSNYSGTYLDPDANLARLNFLQAQGNLYFTTSLGVYKLDVYSGTPSLSGVPKGLDLQLALGATGSAVETANQVAYRMIWGIIDANNNTILGSPSGRSVIANASGNTKDITVTFTIPSGITTSHFFQIYRSVQSGSATIEPTDELQLVYQNNPTGGEIAAGVVAVTDSVPPTLLGASLYSNPSQESILQANERPPKADYTAYFQGCVFFAKCVSKQRLRLTVLSASAISFSDTLVLAGTTYTAKGTETSASGFYSLSKVASTTGDTTNVGAIGVTSVITNVVSTVGVKVGRKLSGTNIPAASYVGAFTANTITIVDSSGGAVAATGANAGGTVTVTPNIADYSVTSTTPSQDIAATVDSLIRVINRYATNTTVSASLLSGYQDLPGQMLIEERGVGSSAFTAAASAHGTAFNPVITAAVSSSNDNFIHQLFFSKKDKPEAVPLLNYKFIGSANNKILGIIPLKSALYIFKEKEGIYRLTGTDPSNFQVDLFDSSAHLIAPDSLAVVNNQIWALTDQGITTVTDTGVSVISRPIEDKILTQTGTALTAMKYYSFGVGYETDRKYILWTVSGSSDTYATQAFVFNTFTRAFTRWPVNASIAMVSPDDTKLYIGSGDTAYTLKERKTLDYTDYVDYSLSVTISSFSGTSIVLSSATGVSVGDVLVQGSIYSVITAVTNNTLTVNDSLTGWTAAAATVSVSFESTIEYAAVTGGNPGTSKQWPQASFLMKSARFISALVGFATDVDAGFEYVTIYGLSTGTWGLFPWGDSNWGGTGVPEPIRTIIPLEKQRASLLRVKFKIKEGYASWKLGGVSIPFRETRSFKIAQ